MTKINTIVTKWISCFVFGLFGGIIFLLFLFSIFETSKINISEIISYHWDFPPLHLLFLAGVCLAFPFINKCNVKKIPLPVLYAFFLACMVLWVAVTRLYPKADQLIIMDRVENMAQKNYQDFLPGGYLYNQPHQIFLAYFSTVLCSIFGRSYVFVFQGLNCLAMLGIYRYLLKLYKKFDGKGSAGMFLVVIFLFLPLTFYVTFVYGTVMGLFFALAAVEILIRYLEDKNLWHILSCTICILLARLFKANYLIFLLGIAAVLVYDFLKSREKSHIIFICVLFCSLLLCSYSLTMFTEKLTGIHSEGGMPGELFVMMGLQNSELGPGWWNGLHEMIFIRHNFDVEVSREIAWEKIGEEVEKMRENPIQAGLFFLKKTVSQWSEPTYESLWIQQDRIRGGGMKMPDLVQRLICNGGRLSEAYTFYCNLFQSFLYFGTLLFVVFHWKTISSDKLLIPAIFIGGFLFHIFWEAKGQYTLPYCVILLPCVVRGYEEFAGFLAGKFGLDNRRR
ncbi:MAG: hypothetical protein NC307_10260 [Roseburia sp.]|nr:hypothetical protein [Roseburia sp.]